MEHLDIGYFCAGLDGEYEAYLAYVEFPNALYNKLKKCYQECGCTDFDEILECNILTEKQTIKLLNMIEVFKNEIIENDVEEYKDIYSEENLAHPEDWEFRFWVEPPEDWDE